MTEKKKNNSPAGKPCFPWVGGKRRLETYVEPFVGGGALFF